MVEMIKFIITKMFYYVLDYYSLKLHKAQILPMTGFPIGTVKGTQPPKYFVLFSSQ